MSKEKNPLPKTADELDNQLEERFFDDLQKNRFARPVTERFEDEYFNEAERENMPPHMFALAKEVASEFPTDSRPQRSEDARKGQTFLTLTQNGARGEKSESDFSC